MASGSRERVAGVARAVAPTGRDDSAVALLEQALWKRLGEASDLATLAPAWLSLQVGMIPGVTRGVVVRTAADGGGHVGMAVWPEGITDVSALAAAVDLAVKEGRGIVKRPDPGDGTPPEQARGAPDCTQIAYPLIVQDRPAGAVALELEGSVAPRLRMSMRQLQWGTAWLRERLAQNEAEAARRQVEQTRAALELLATALEEEGFASAARAVVTEIGLGTGCERVSLGFVKNGHAVVAAISHSAQFGKRMNLVRLLGAAMDEAIDQQAVILWPAPDDEPHATRAHEELARANASGAVLTAPIFLHDRFIGALTFERPAGARFSAHDIALLEGAASVVGPMLEEKRRNDRWIVVKLAESAANQAKRLLGPGYYGRKLAAVAAAAALAFGYFATATYRVTANAVIEGEVQRAVVAPFDGFIKEAHARAGDKVAQGTVLAALDDRDLTLERLRWVTERQKRLYEYDKALGDRSRADSRIARTQIEQAEAQVRLIDEQLARVKLIAPFDSVVVSGDLSQQIGAAIERGQALFQVAPLDAYRVILEVDESQIADVAAGQTGTLLASPLPDAPFPLVVERITPVAVARDGRNFFRVEARLTGPSTNLLPGMKGVGKVDVDARRLVWIWTRAFLNWLRIATWSWLG